MLNLFNILPSLNVFIFIAITFAFLRAFINIIVYASIFNIRFNIIRSSIIDTYSDFFNAKWSFFTSNSYGTMGNTLIKEILKFSDSFSIIGMVSVKIFQALCYVIACFFISWKLSLMVFLPSIVIALPFLFIGKISYRLGQQNVQASNSLFSTVQENLSAAKLIIAYNQKSTGLRSVREIVERYISADFKSLLLQTSTPFVFQPFGIAIILIALLLSQNFLQIPLSELILILYAFYLIIPTVGQVIGQKNQFMTLYPSYEQLNLMQYNAQKDQQSSGENHFETLRESIEFKNVGFRYKVQDCFIQNMNILIPKGKMVALVGRSGAGKSTIVDLLLRLYDPQEGEIFVDGDNLKKIDVYSWRNRLGYVPQDIFLFNTSIKNNLLWAKPDATEKEINDACNIAFVNEFIESLPCGLDTIVGERGVSLSNGQRQRIALARAIIKKPVLLVLDEATSSLDSISEKYIQNALDMIVQNTTILAVAHRLSTIANAHYIYVVENGKIIEEGTLGELSLKKGTYYEMAKVQGVLS